MYTIIKKFGVNDKLKLLFNKNALNRSKLTVHQRILKNISWFLQEYSSNTTTLMIIIKHFL